MRRVYTLVCAKCARALEPAEAHPVTGLHRRCGGTVERKVVVREKD